MVKKIVAFLVFFFFIAIKAISAAAQINLNIQTWQTQNGVSVYYLPTQQIPIVDIRLIFAAGSAYDGNQYGLAQLTNMVVGEATTQLSADQVADQFDDLGVQFDQDVDRDKAIYGLRSLTNPDLLTPALNLFQQLIVNPDLSNNQVIQQRNKLQSEIAEQLQSPQAMADQQFYQTLYGNFPYGHPITGTVQTVANLTQQEVANFYKQYYVAKNATVVIVGNINLQQARNIAEQITKNLPAGQSIAPLANPVPLKSSINKIVKFPSTQNYIRIGTLGVAYNNPDKFPLLVGNYTLGGGTLVSRLFEEVRAKRGLSYNVMSAFLPMQVTGPFIIQLQTTNQTANQAVQVSLQTLNQFLKAGPTPVELAAAKQNLIGSMPVKLDSNADLADAITLISFYHLPLNYFATYDQKVAAVTSEQIKAAFNKYIDSNKLVIVRVGG